MEADCECVDLTVDDNDDNDVCDVTPADAEVMDCDGGRDQRDTSDNDIEIVAVMGNEIVPVVEEPRFDLAEEFKRNGNEHFKNGSYYQALEMYTQAIEATLTSPVASYYGNRAACYMMLRSYRKALYDVRQALELDPKNAKCYVRLIRITLALGNVKECKLAFETAKKEGVTICADFEYDSLHKFKKLKSEMAYWRAKGDYAKVIALATQAIEIASGDSIVKMMKAEALIRIGKYREAKEIAMNVIKHDRQCDEALYVHAICLYLEDDLGMCVQVVRQLLASDPDNKIYQRFGKKAKKMQDYRANGRLKFNARNYVGALEEYNKCLALVRSDELNNPVIESKIYFNLALIAFHQNEADVSLETCSKAIKLNPKYVKAIIHRGRLYVRKQMYNDAICDFEAALKLDSSNEELQDELAKVKLAAKKASRKDFYKILNVAKNATEDEIRKAYKKRALLHHPDRHASATEAVQKEQERLFKDLREAYEVLSDPRKRTDYDRRDNFMDGGGFVPFRENANYYNAFFNPDGFPSFSHGTHGSRWDQPYGAGFKF